MAKAAVINFDLRFPVQDIPVWAKRYDSRLLGKPTQMEAERYLEGRIGPDVRKRGHFTKTEFLHLSRWKSPRTIRHCDSNSEEYVNAVTTAALASRNEQFRIECLTILKGVNWPTASVILHFGSTSLYPILDFRAIWSLRHAVPKVYSFSFWESYVAYCGELAETARVGMRELDRALWEYSKDRQPRNG